jgi:hypothetical protein
LDPIAGPVYATHDIEGKALVSEDCACPVLLQFVTIPANRLMTVSFSGTLTFGDILLELTTTDCYIVDICETSGSVCGTLSSIRSQVSMSIGFFLREGCHGRDQATGWRSDCCWKEAALLGDAPLATVAAVARPFERRDPLLHAPV